MSVPESQPTMNKVEATQDELADKIPSERKKKRVRQIHVELVERIQVSISIICRSLCFSILLCNLLMQCIQQIVMCNF